MKKIKYKLWFLMSTLLLLGATLADPTRPPEGMIKATSTDTTQSVTLTAIFVSPQHQYAIINGGIIRVGEKVGPYIVTSITTNGVELMGPQNARELVTVSPVVKTPGKGS